MKNNPLMKRMDCLKQLAVHPHYKTLLARVRGKDAAFIQTFIVLNCDLDKNQWATKVNRLWLDTPDDRPKNHAILWEILSVIGSMQD